MSPRMRLRDARHWIGFTNYLIGNQEGLSYKATSKGVMGDQEEYSREKQQWRHVIFDGKDLIRRIHHYKDASSLEIGADLVQEELEEISKVVIVSFLYFIPWVLGLCNHFNIVSSVQLDRRENLLTPTSIYTASGIMNADLLRVRRLELVGCLEKNTEYT